MARGEIYLPLSVDFCSNPRVLRAGERAGWLYVAAALLSKRMMSDGFIEDVQLPSFGLTGMKARVDALVREGLWDRVDGGFQIVGFLDRNPTREQVMSDRKSEAERKRRERGSRLTTTSAKTDDNVSEKPGQTSDQNQAGSSPWLDGDETPPAGDTGARPNGVRSDNRRTPAGQPSESANQRQRQDRDKDKTPGSRRSGDLRNAGPQAVDNEGADAVGVDPWGAMGNGVDRVREILAEPDAPAEVVSGAIAEARERIARPKAAP